MIPAVKIEIPRTESESSEKDKAKQIRLKLKKLHNLAMQERSYLHHN